MAAEREHKNGPLIFLLPSLAGGGAEKAAALLAPELVRSGNLTLALLQDRCIFPLPDHIARIAFSPPLRGTAAHLIRLPYHVWSLVRLVRRSGAGTVLSFMEQANLVNLLAARLTGHRAVLSQRTNPRRQYAAKGLLGKLIVRASAALYKRGEGVIAVSAGIRDILVADYGVEPERVRVIANPVDIDTMTAQARNAPAVEPGGRFLLHVGRLDLATKRHDFLLDAFRQVQAVRPDIRLVLVGDGPDGPALRTMIAGMGLDGAVVLTGWQDNVASFMARAVATLLCSRYEGWPNVLVEAMSVGCPVIATDCPTGPREITAGGRYGLLVPQEDVAAFARACLSLIDDQAERERYAILARQRSRDFALKVVAGQYRHALR